MKYSADVEHELKVQERKKKRFDASVVMVMILGLIGHASIMVLWNNPASVVEWCINIVLGLLIAAPFMSICGKLGGYIENRFFPSYIIKTENGVRKLFGAYGISSNQVYKDLLIPGYKIYKGDMYKDEHCSLVAVPCEHNDEKIKDELKKLDLDASHSFG